MAQARIIQSVCVLSLTVVRCVLGTEKVPTGAANENTQVRSGHVFSVFGEDKRD